MECIELMIVVAIIGILAAIAVPAYQKYQVRTKWASNIADIEGVKNSIRICMITKANQGALCDTLSDLQEAGFAGSVLPTPRYANGVIVLKGVVGNVNISFQGTSEVMSLNYDADGAVDASGNMVFTKTNLDTLGEFYKHNKR
ncbi:pilus assembly protein [Acinetobacter haemolyticus]|uniref:pilus assembly protein n=1 Tax=Acinetobacter haemolyticus TaxID=29430 RepID=UPI000C2BEE63|nr:pilus assembly protein [Acinetobacter haemolyticus]ATZ66200.1 pilus assembly protein [Acinetobacter haemolyticus]NAS08839.1 pilus assembly protein [Acinetobacter haemolyticus]